MNGDKTQWVDLASRPLGAGVIYANDELFADRENLIKPEGDGRRLGDPPTPGDSRWWTGR